MRNRERNHERTLFQDGHPFDPRIDIKTDVAIVYGLDTDLPQRIQSWSERGYIAHVMTGVSWGTYQDYVRGEWDGTPHHDDAQAGIGDFKLEHGVSQGRDIYYMVPTESYLRYLLEKLKRVVDAGAVAIHLEEPEFWVRAGYGAAFKAEWRNFYGEDWQDPLSSPDTRFRAGRLQQNLYTRAIRFLCQELKAYARSAGVPDFCCFVPTHSLINYAHWRIVSPETQLIDIPECDGLIAQVWTGTARTPIVYCGVVRERTFEAAYCEYASVVGMLRGSDKRVWFLADPIEDDPNHSWEDYRLNWERTLTAALMFSEVSRFEVSPWPMRVFTASYPKTDALRDLPLREVVSDYASRLDTLGAIELAAETRDAAARFERFCVERGSQAIETLGFASTPMERELRFENVLHYLFDFYQFLNATETPGRAVTLRDAFSKFIENPVEEREGLPADYATELLTVFNALADMNWDDSHWEVPQPGIGLCVSDTLMYQRGEPNASDPHLSSVFGLALPLIKHGLPIQIPILERATQPGYLDAFRVLLLSYVGMKPVNANVHIALQAWVDAGGILILFGNGDSYNAVRAWWNEAPFHYDSPQDHLLHLLGCHPLEEQPQPAGRGVVYLVSTSPVELAFDSNGAEIIRNLVRFAMEQIECEWPETNTLVMRRGPYVIAAGLEETEISAAKSLPGRFISLFDPRLSSCVNPVIVPGSSHLWFDLDWDRSQPAKVIAASGRVNNEYAEANVLSFTVESANGTTIAAAVQLPMPPQAVDLQPSCSSQQTWDGTILRLFLSDHSGSVQLHIRW